MSCAVNRYLPADDSSDDEVERTVHSGMRIVRDRQPIGKGRPRRRFRPKENFELEIESDLGNVVLLRAFRRKGGDLIAELHHQSVKLRSLHTHEGHLNPGLQDRFPNGHMHFPTVDFPLVERKSSYAYELNCSDDKELVLFIDDFCALFDIQMGPFQLILDTVRNV